jgi:hypothetical protein
MGSGQSQRVLRRREMACNAQGAVGEASELIVAEDVVNEESDNRRLVSTLAAASCLRAPGAKFRDSLQKVRGLVYAHVLKIPALSVLAS